MEDKTTEGIISVQLGDEVRDPLSGFQGIAMARHTFLHGCSRISVQPKVKEDGSMPNASSFDEPQLEVIRSVAQEGDKTKGGPEKYMPSDRYGG